MAITQHAINALQEHEWPNSIGVCGHCIVTNMISQGLAGPYISKNSGEGYPDSHPLGCPPFFFAVTKCVFRISELHAQW